MVPSSKLSFNPKIHLCRGDVIFDQNVVIVLVKWSKTLQNSDQGSYIIIPKLGSSPLCPVSASQTMAELFPAHENQPLFMNSQGVITQNQVRTHLKSIMVRLNLDSALHSFHTFRRSGVTLAFNIGADINHIKRHGMWLSDAVHA